jgi:hypothetical protein
MCAGSGPNRAAPHMMCASAPATLLNLMASQTMTATTISDLAVSC